MPLHFSLLYSLLREDRLSENTHSNGEPREELSPKQWIHVKDFRPWIGTGIRFDLYSLESWNHRNLQKVKQLLQTRSSKKASDRAKAAVLQNGYRLWYLRVLQKINLCLVLIYYWFRENSLFSLGIKVCFCHKQEPLLSHSPQIQLIAEFSKDCITSKDRLQLRTFT